MKSWKEVLRTFPVLKVGIIRFEKVNIIDTDDGIRNDYGKNTGRK